MPALVQGVSVTPGSSDSSPSFPADAHVQLLAECHQEALLCSCAAAGVEAARLVGTQQTHALSGALHWSCGQCAAPWCTTGQVQPVVPGGCAVWLCILFHRPLPPSLGVSPGQAPCSIPHLAVLTMAMLDLGSARTSLPALQQPDSFFRRACSGLPGPSAAIPARILAPAGARVTVAPPGRRAAGMRSAPSSLPSRGTHAGAAVLGASELGGVGEAAATAPSSGCDLDWSCGGAGAGVAAPARARCPSCRPVIQGSRSMALGLGRWLGSRWRAAPRKALAAWDR